jgi:two-component system, OmpR family, sensor histidine kinase BaeS
MNFTPSSSTERLGIRDQIWLLLLAAVLLTALAIGGVVAWNLKAGFGDYLRARDAQQASRLAQLVAEWSAQDQQMNWLRGDPAAMRRLMEEFSRREGLRIPVSGPPGPEQLASPGAPRRAATPGGLIGPRTQIHDAQDQWVAGRGQPVGFAVIREPIKLQGQTIGWVRVTVQPDEEGVDASFLKRQYLGLGAAALAAVLVSLLLGGWAARRWSQPLGDVQQAARRISLGELDIRVAAGGSREIHALAHDINHMAQSLKQLEESRRAWIAQNSHELRTPLAVLLGEIESMQDGVRKASPEVMENLREEVMQLTRLVNDLHLLSVADMGALPCEFLEGDASASLQRIADRYEPRLASHGLTLKTHGPRKMPACWDFGRIEQLLINLLENSLRYTDAPGRVQLVWEPVFHEGQPALRITVDDTAPGVKEADLPKLFEPLFRADSARQRNSASQGAGHGQHGSGLGLAIVRAIVQAHQGSIEAKPSSMGGVQIVVVLPLDHHETPGPTTITQPLPLH